MTLQRLQSCRMILANTQQTVNLAEEALGEAAINYANGFCDINTYTLALNRWATANNNYLTALEEFWTTYYHLQTIIQYE